MLYPSDKCRKKAISIGCSCINTFQMGFCFDGNKIYGSLFNQNIVTPRSTIQVFKAIQDQSVFDLFKRRANYEIEQSHLKNICLEGFYFWHENGAELLNRSNLEPFHQFQKKVEHLLDNMLRGRNGVHLVWSNIQPNLQAAVETLSMGWDKFQLSAEVYRELKSEAGKVFNSPTFSFICRPEDIDSDVAHNADVYIIDLPRGPDFKGRASLFQKAFEPILHRNGLEKARRSRSSIIYPGSKNAESTLPNVATRRIPMQFPIMDMIRHFSHKSVLARTIRDKSVAPLLAKIKERSLELITRKNDSSAGTFPVLSIGNVWAKKDTSFKPAQLCTDYLRSTGWHASVEQGVAVDSNGPVPWFTYAATTYLSTIVRANQRVLEFGAGNSTRWWSKRVMEVVSVEHDPSWSGPLINDCFPNVTVFERYADEIVPTEIMSILQEEFWPLALGAIESPDPIRNYRAGLLDGMYLSYASVPLGFPKGYFDIIVIDGMARVLTTWVAARQLADKGMIIFDNSDREEYADAYRYLEENGFVRIDFCGLGPVNSYGWCTSIFVKSLQPLERGKTR